MAAFPSFISTHSAAASPAVDCPCSFEKPPPSPPVEEDTLSISLNARAMTERVYTKHLRGLNTSMIVGHFFCKFRNCITYVGSVDQHAYVYMHVVCTRARVSRIRAVNIYMHIHWYYVLALIFYGHSIRDQLKSVCLRIRYTWSTRQANPC